MRTRDEMAANQHVSSDQFRSAAGDGLATGATQHGPAIPNELSASAAAPWGQLNSADSGGASPALIRRKAVRRATSGQKSIERVPGADVAVGQGDHDDRQGSANSGSGLVARDNRPSPAAPDQFAGHISGDDQLPRASVGMDQGQVVTHFGRVHPQTIAAIQSLHREHRAIQRAVGDMDRRIKAEARWFAVRRYRAEGIPLPAGKFPDVTKADEQMVIATRARFFMIRDAIEAQRKACQKELLALVKPLPIMGWAKDVKGLGLPSVAAIIGEAGDLNNYANPGKLWKRMGLAVIDGKSQGKRTNADEAARHGYSPQRRSEMHVVGDCLVRAGGPYADMYRARKAVEMEREGITKMHAHKRALRYIEKRLLREMWQAWRGAIATSGPGVSLPPADELAGQNRREIRGPLASQDGGHTASDIPMVGASVQPSRVKRVRRAKAGLNSVGQMPGAELVAAE